MRTITQRTTLPFLIAESGAASFTAAVTTSPKPARRPRSPPRGKMQDSLRAPLLSATSRIVRIPIIVSSLPSRLPTRRRNRLRHQSKSRVCSGGADGSVCLVSATALHLHIQLLGLCAHLRGAPHDIHQTPPLQFAERAAL